MKNNNIIHQFSSRTQIINPTRELVEIAREISTARFATSKYDYRQRKQVYDRLMQLCYYDNNTNTIPAGWINNLKRELDTQGIIYSNGANYVYPDQSFQFNTDEGYPKFFELIKLRWYQNEALTAILTNKRGIVHHPTRSGKTVVMGAVIATVGQKTVICVNTKILLEQIYKEMVTWFGEANVGKIGDGEWDDKPITVASIQTLTSRIHEQKTREFLNSIRIFMLDEAHHVSYNEKSIMNSYFTIAMNINYAPIRLGFTASVGELSDVSRKLLTGATGEIIHQVSIQRLTEEGYLVQGVVKLYPMEAVTALDNIRDARTYGIFNNPERNEAIAHFARLHAAEGKRVLVDFKEIKKQGNILKALIPEATTLFGKAKIKERKEVLADFAAGKINILISNLLSEGIDVPSMDCVINCTGYSNDKSVTQLSGRVLTISKGKKEAIIYDFADNDTPDIAYKDGYLTRWSQKRIREYGKLGFRIDHLEKIHGDLS